MEADLSKYTSNQIIYELIRRGKTVEYCGKLYVPTNPGSRRLAYRVIDIARTISKVTPEMLRVVLGEVEKGSPGKLEVLCSEAPNSDAAFFVQKAIKEYGGS